MTNKIKNKHRKKKIALEKELKNIYLNKFCVNEQKLFAAYHKRIKSILNPSFVINKGNLLYIFDIKVTTSLVKFNFYCDNEISYFNYYYNNDETTISNLELELKIIN